MTLSRKIADAVESLPAAAALPRLVEAEAGPARLALNLTARGPVGIAFDGLDFAATDRADLSADALRAWGDRLAARLTYLMEPLVVLEVDAQAGEAELRSQAPTPRGDRRSFYEVRLRREGSPPPPPGRLRRRHPAPEGRPLPDDRRGPRAAGRRPGRQPRLSSSRDLPANPSRRGGPPDRSEGRPVPFRERPT